MGVLMVGVLAEDQLQIPFAGDQHPVQALAAGTGDPAFGYTFARGAWTGVLTICTPIAVNTASNVAVNFVSRSRIKNFGLSVRPSRLISWLGLAGSPMRRSGGR